MGRIFQSLIQGSFGGAHKNFEAVVLEQQDLWHWWRDNSAPGTPWHRGQRVAGQAAFPGSMIQGSFGSNFEVVVPIASGANVELWHFWHDNSDAGKPWSRGQRVTEANRRVIGAASLIQSDFRAGQHGNFEVVVPVINNSGQPELRHYWRDNSDVTKPWSSGQRVNDPAHQVLGPACLIQSDFRGGGHGNFEVVAWVRLPDGRTVLQHYWHDNSDVNRPWQSGQVVWGTVKGPGVIIQSSFGLPGHGNFEVVVPVPAPDGRTYLQHVWHENSNVNLPWRAGQIVTEVASPHGAGCLIESDYRTGSIGDFELLVDECTQSLIGYVHPNSKVGLPWLRNAQLLGEPAAREIRDTIRVCQLTGEVDRTGWNGVGQPPFAFNRTESRFGVRGTDLGVSFDYRNRVYFLFGDTWRVGETATSHFDWDAIAFCTDTAVAGGLSLTFYKQPPIAIGIKQGAFEVPLDGFSFEDRMFVFFSTDHTAIGDVQIMGRSVLCESDNDGYDFTPLFAFSLFKFINVSVQRARLDATTAATLGWSAGLEVLWVWGSGRYRQSPVYLAVADLQALLRVRRTPEADPQWGEEGPVRFLAGGVERPRWSSHEADAVPLFCASDVGELSARWHAPFARYFLTYNTGNPRGITLRHAANSWGPWSAPIVIFDPGWGSGSGQPVGAGYGRFMHIPWTVAHVDNVQDDAFLGGRRDNEWGGEYGPYQISRFSRGAPDGYDLYYTMSTWNPYQVMLMRTRVTTRDLT